MKHYHSLDSSFQRNIRKSVILAHRISTVSGPLLEAPQTPSLRMLDPSNSKSSHQSDLRTDWLVDTSVKSSFNTVCSPCSCQFGCHSECLIYQRLQPRKTKPSVSSSWLRELIAPCAPSLVPKAQRPFFSIS